MADSIHVSIYTAEGKKLDKMVKYVSIPSDDGPVGVLAGHLPLLCSMSHGTVLCHYGEDSKLSYEIRDGIAGVSDNDVLILASQAWEIE